MFYRKRLAFVKQKDLYARSVCRCAATSDGDAKCVRRAFLSFRASRPCWRKESLRQAATSVDKNPPGRYNKPCRHSVRRLMLHRLAKPFADLMFESYGYTRHCPILSVTVNGLSTTDQQACVKELRIPTGSLI